MKKTLFITTLALALAGCTGDQQAAKVDKEYDELVAKAKAEIKLADQTGYHLARHGKIPEGRRRGDEGR